MRPFFVSTHKDQLARRGLLSQYFSTEPREQPVGIRTFVLMAILALPASADEAERYQCAGENPNWDLTLSGSEARFAYDHRDTNFDVPLTTTAENRNWPRAYTLIAEADTAIVLLEQAICSDGDTHRAHVLTQRGQTPILLTGCCRVAE